ncbi:MAG: Yip1 family protein, partial [Pseudomonadota bacterium]
MFDPSKTIGLISGGLTSPRETWESYLGENPGWQRTAVELTIPMVVSAIIIGWLLSLLLGGYFYYGYGRGVVLGLIVGLIAAAISIAVMSFVVSALAGVFGGQANFDRAFAAVSLATIPTWAGAAVGGIPFIGWLLQLAGSITGLVFLYKIIPLAVLVPENKRVVHFVLTLVTVFVINIILGLIFGLGAATSGELANP